MVESAAQNMIKKSTYNILIGGPAGSGIESSGMLLGKALVRAGANVFAMNEIMSLIRGGHNYNRVRFSFSEPVYCHDDMVDVVLAFDKLSVSEHAGELHEGGIVVDLSGDVGVDGIYKNTVAIGVVFGLFGLELKWIEALLKETFAGKGAEVVDENLAALKKGAEMSGGVKFEVEGKGGGKGRVFLNGNDAICLGAVAAGCKFVSEYPMTPSSSILHTMAKWASEKGVVVKHAEDEIAAMNMIVGGGFAGARAMTGTSGGGFALMTEAVGMAGCSETPCVVVEAQRAGPSTGLPTRTEQGDLRQVMHASQGDYPRLVMAPGDFSEAFSMAFAAFNYADVFQLPVLILMDKFISESVASVEAFDTKGLKIERGKIVGEVSGDVTGSAAGFKRYALSKDGVSVRTLPGTKGGMHVATSYEHDEWSSLKEDPATRVAQMDKRMKKMEGLLEALPEPCLIDGNGGKIDGTDSCAVVLVAFGSTGMVLMEAVKLLAEEGVKANILMIKYLVPFHAKKVGEILNEVLGRGGRVVLVEQNYSGQLGGVIAENTGILIKNKILKYDGREMDARFVVNLTKKFLA